MMMPLLSTMAAFAAVPVPVLVPVVDDVSTVRVAPDWLMLATGRSQATRAPVDVQATDVVP